MNKQINKYLRKYSLRKAVSILKFDIAYFDYLRTYLTPICSKLEFCEETNLSSNSSEVQDNTEESELTQQIRNPSPITQKLQDISFLIFEILKISDLKK